MSPSRSSAVGAGAAIGVTLLVGFAAAPPALSEPDLRGCSSRPESESAGMPHFGFAVDGEMVAVYDRGEVASVMDEEGVPDVSEIDAIEIVCWAAVERTYGVRVRSGISAIWTYDPFAGSREFLREAYSHVRAGGELGELVPPSPDLTATREDLGAEGHFHLELRHPVRRRVCRVTTEATPARPGGSTALERAGSKPGEPYCASLHDHGGSGG